MNIEIANRLLDLRKKNNLSQEELAEQLGVSRQAVSKWERAEASPDTDNLIALAKLYKVSLDEMLLLKDVQEMEAEQAKDVENQSEPELYAEGECCLEGIHSIQIDVSGRDIRICQAQAGSTVSIEEYLGRNEESLQTCVENGTLLVSEKKRKDIGVPMFSCFRHTASKVYIPEDFVGRLEVEAAAGDIEINGRWDLSELAVSTASGDITVDITKAERIQLSTSSGDIQFGGGSGHGIMKTASGDIEAIWLCGELEAESSSGDIELKLKKITAAVKAETVSGDIDINIAANSNCRLTAESVNGDVSANFHFVKMYRKSENYVDAIFGDKAQDDVVPHVVMQTISGDIEIHG